MTQNKCFPSARKLELPFLPISMWLKHFPARKGITRAEKVQGDRCVVASNYQTRGTGTAKRKPPTMLLSRHFADL